MSLLTALSSDDLDRLRTATGSHTCEAYLSINPLSVVATAQIDVPLGFIDDSIGGFQVDNTSANWAEGKAGMTVLVGSAPLAGDIGSFRMRLDTVSNYIYIGEISNSDSGNTITLTPSSLYDNAYVTIILDANLWSVYPRITYMAGGGTFYKDYDRPYVDQNETAIPAVLRLGAHTAAWVDTTTGVLAETRPATIQDFDGATMASTQWTIYGTGATILGGSDSTDTLMVEYEPGFYIVRFDTTLSNGAVLFGYRNVWAHHPDDYPPLEIKINSDRLERSGRQVNLTAVDGTALSTLVTGAMVMVWWESLFDEESLDTSTTDRFPGFIKTINPTYKPPADPVFTLDIVSGYLLLKDLNAFSQQLSVAENPANWQEAIGGLLNIDFMTVYLLFYHSTALQLFDLFLPSLTNYASHALAVSPGNLIGQLDSLYRRLPAAFGQGSDGTWWGRRDPMLLHTNGSRDAIPERMTLTADDIAIDGLSFSRPVRPPTGRVEGYAFQSSTSPTPTAYHCYAAGRVAGQGLGSQTLEGQLVATQEELNIRTANYRARLNNPYKELRVSLTRNYPVFEPAVMRWVRLTLAAEDSPTGEALDSRALVTSISFSYGPNGARRTSLVLELESNSIDAPGQTIPVDIGNGLTTDDLNLPTYNSDSSLLPRFDLASSFGLNKYKGVLGVPPMTAKIASTSPTDKGTPTSVYILAWNAMLTRATSRSNPTWAQLQELDMGESTVDVVRGASNAGWVLSDTTLYRTTDFSAGTPTFVSKQALTDYELLRYVAGVSGGNSLAAYRFAAVADQDPLTFDFTAGEQGFEVPGGFGGTYSTGNGWTYTDEPGTVVGTHVRLGYFRYNFGAPVTLKALELTYDLSGTLGNTEMLLRHTGTNPTGSFTAITSDTSTGTGLTLSWTGSLSTIQYLWIVGLCDSQLTTTSLSGDLLVISITVTLGDGTRITYTPDGGNTITTKIVGQAVGDQGADVDDYNLGIHVVAASKGIAFTTAYDGAAQFLTGLTGLNGSVNVTCIRLPYKKLATQAANSDAEALQFIYGTSDAVGGSTLWGVTFNSTDGTIVSQSDMTPIISATTYTVLAMHALESYGSNTQRLLAFAQPVGGGATVLIGSTDGGSTWAIKSSSFDGERLHFVGATRGGNGSKAWVSGTDGIGYTEDFGTTVSDKTTNFDTVTGSTPALGAFG